MAPRNTCFVLLTLVSLAGCSSTPVLPQQSSSQKTLGAGWQCLLAPGGFDGPGTILEYDENGTKFEVVNLETVIKIEKRPAAIGEYVENKSLSSSIVASFLSGIIPNAKGKLEAGASSKLNASVSFTNVTEERADGSSELVANEWIAANQKRFRPKSTYFFVREAYTASGLKYGLTSAQVLSLGGEAELKAGIGIKGTVFSIDNGTNYKLEHQTATPLRVCIKSREIGTIGAGAGGEIIYGMLNGYGSLPETK